MRGLGVRSRSIFRAAATFLLAAALNTDVRVSSPSQTPVPGGGRGGVNNPRTAYPDRPPADPVAVERGQSLYRVNCAFCHDVDTRGGDSGPSLLRSGLVLDDQRGELIGPVVRNGRVDR